jgi:hypothetical protein
MISDGLCEWLLDGNRGRDGNTWKMVSLTWNVTMPPPPANK